MVTHLTTAKGKSDAKDKHNAKLHAYLALGIRCYQLIYSVFPRFPKVWLEHN